MRTEETLEREQSGALLSGSPDGNGRDEAMEQPAAGRQKKLAPVTSVALVYAKGQAIYRETHRANAIFQVVSGAVILTRQDADGRRHVLEIVGPGSILGVVPGAHYGCHAKALTRTTLRRIDRSKAERSAALQKIIAQALMQQVEKMRDEASLRTRRSAAECVAALILSLPKLNSAVESEGREDYRLALSQTDMASHLGLALETVCRIMRDLKRKGAIGTSGRDRIAILDARALAQLAAGKQGAQAQPEFRPAAAG